jgi:hypothetical protein
MYLINTIYFHCAEGPRSTRQAALAEFGKEDAMSRIPTPGTIDAAPSASQPVLEAVNK